MSGYILEEFKGIVLPISRHYSISIPPENILKSKFVGNMGKGRISKRLLQGNKPRQFFLKKKKPLFAHARVDIRGKKCSFFGKFAVLCFLVKPFLRFALLPYCRQGVQVLLGGIAMKH